MSDLTFDAAEREAVVYGMLGGAMPPCATQEQLDPRGDSGLGRSGRGLLTYMADLEAWARDQERAALQARIHSAYEDRRRALEDSDFHRAQVLPGSAFRCTLAQLIAELPAPKSTAPVPTAYFAGVAAMRSITRKLVRGDS